MSDIWAASEEWKQLVRITDDLVDALNKSIEHLPFDAVTPTDPSARLSRSQSPRPSAQRTHDRQEEEEDKCADRVTAMEQRAHSSGTPTQSQTQAPTKTQAPPTTSTPEEGVQISKTNGSGRKHGHGNGAKKGTGTGTGSGIGAGTPPPIMPKPKLDPKLVAAAARPMSPLAVERPFPFPTSGASDENKGGHRTSPLVQENSTANRLLTHTFGPGHRNDPESASSPQFNLTIPLTLSNSVRDLRAAAVDTLDEEPTKKAKDARRGGSVRLNSNQQKDAAAVSAGSNKERFRVAQFFTTRNPRFAILVGQDSPTLWRTASSLADLHSMRERERQQKNELERREQRERKEGKEQREREERRPQSYSQTQSQSPHRTDAGIKERGRVEEKSQRAFARPSAIDLPANSACPRRGTEPQVQQIPSSSALDDYASEQSGRDGSGDGNGESFKSVLEAVEAQKMSRLQAVAHLEGPKAFLAAAAGTGTPKHQQHHTNDEDLQDEHNEHNASGRQKRSEQQKPKSRQRHRLSIHSIGETGRERCVGTDGSERQRIAPATAPAPVLTMNSPRSNKQRIEEEIEELDGDNRSRATKHTTKLRPPQSLRVQRSVTRSPSSARGGAGAAASGKSKPLGSPALSSLMFGLLPAVTAIAGADLPGLDAVVEAGVEAKRRQGSCYSIRHGMQNPNLNTNPIPNSGPRVSIAQLSPRPLLQAAQTVSGSGSRLAALYDTRGRGSYSGSVQKAKSATRASCWAACFGRRQPKKTRSPKFASSLAEFSSSLIPVPSKLPDLQIEEPVGRYCKKCVSASPNRQPLSPPPARAKQEVHVHALELQRPALASREAEQAETEAEVGEVRVGMDADDAEELLWIDNPMHTALSIRTRDASPNRTRQEAYTRARTRSVSCQTLRSSPYRGSESDCGRTAGDGWESPSPVREHMVRSAIARRGGLLDVDSRRANANARGPAGAGAGKHQKEGELRAQKRRRHSSVVQPSVSSGRSDRSRGVNQEPLNEGPQEVDGGDRAGRKESQKDTQFTPHWLTSAAVGDAHSAQWRVIAPQPLTKAVADARDWNGEVDERKKEQSTNNSHFRNPPAPRLSIAISGRHDEEEDEQQIIGEFVRSQSSPKSRRARNSEHHVRAAEGDTQTQRQRDRSYSVSTTSAHSKPRRHGEHRERVEEEDEERQHREEVQASSRRSSRPVSLICSESQTRTSSPANGSNGSHSAAAGAISRADVERSLHVLTQLVDQLRLDKQNELEHQETPPVAQSRHRRHPFLRSNRVGVEETTQQHKTTENNLTPQRTDIMNGTGRNASNTSSAQLSPLTEFPQSEAPLIGIGSYSEVPAIGGPNGASSNAPTQWSGHNMPAMSASATMSSYSYSATRRSEPPVVPPMPQPQMLMDESQLLLGEDSNANAMFSSAYSNIQTNIQPTTGVNGINGKHLQQQQQLGGSIIRPRTWTHQHSLSSHSHRPRGRAVALHSYVARNDRELSFESGDVIGLIRQVDENWFKGECGGRRGIFPVNHVQVLVSIDEARGGGGLVGAMGDSMIGSALVESPSPETPPTLIHRQEQAMAQAVALFDFEAESPFEMSFRKGEVINVLRRVDANWLEGATVGEARRGIFPATYVQESL